MNALDLVSVAYTRVFSDPYPTVDAVSITKWSEIM